VRGKQDGGLLAVGQPVHEIVEFAPGLGVEPGRRLVEEQQLGPAHDADGHVQAASLPAGQAANPLAGLLGEPDRGDELVHVPRPRHTRHRVRRVVRTQVREQLPDPPFAMVPPGLQHHSDPGPPRLPAARRIGAEHTDLPGRPHPEALEYFDRRGLARPVRPEQGQYLAPARAERHTGQDVGPTVPHPQVAHVEHEVLRRFFGRVPCRTRREDARPVEHRHIAPTTRILALQRTIAGVLHTGKGVPQCAVSRRQRPARFSAGRARQGCPRPVRPLLRARPPGCPPAGPSSGRRTVR
jgi:hypothetical protein